MPQASTWLDLVVGADIHIELVPTPAGPVPMPFPLPFVGLTGDPAGAAMSGIQTALVSLASGGDLASSVGVVLVNGLPATTTATTAKNNVSLIHLVAPPGGSFVRPPGGDATLPLGALTVALGGDSAIRLGDPALSCSDPVRLQTSTVVTIPKGRPVEIGGPPGINAEQAIGNFLAARAIRTAWGAAGGLFKHLARLTPTRLRNLIPRAECFFTGHPVDVATGRVMTWTTDFELPGAIPLAFTREYASSWAGRRCSLGPGWSHSLDRAVWIEPGRIVARVADGREIVFEAAAFDGVAPPVGTTLRDGISKFLVRRTARGWSLTAPDGMIDDFEPVVGDPLDTADQWGLARVVSTSRRGDGPRIRYSYDDKARLTAVRDSADRVIRFENDHLGRLIRVLLPNPIDIDRWNVHVEFSYSVAGDLAEARDALGNATRYSYDAHLMVQETNRNGLSFFWIYDGRSSHARCVRTWGDGGIYDCIIDYGDRFTTVTDSYDHTTLYRTNEAGAVSEIRDPAGNTTKRQYDADLNLIAETDPLGRVTRQSYSALGLPVLILTPDGERVAFKHHRKMPELVTLYQDQCGSLWRRAYDRRGQPTSLTGPLGDRTTFEWRDGLVVAAVEPGGRRTEYTHANGNPIATKLPSGGEIKRVFDLRGRMVAMTDPTGARTLAKYDLLDRLTEVTEADGTVRTFSYDGEGNLAQAVDQGRHLRLAHAGFNWLVERDEGGDVVKFKYDLEGRLVEIRNERGHTYSLEYDLCGRLVREIGFDLQATAYTHDAAGRTIEVADGRGATKLVHDVMDRIVEKAFPDGKKVTFSYRQDGALLSAINDTVGVTFTRDAVGNIIQEQQGDHIVTSIYSPAGERVAMRSSLGADIAIDRGPLGESRAVYIGPARERQMELRFQHDSLGREISRSTTTGVVATWDYDSAGQPIVRAARTETSRWTRAYAWRPGDQLGAIDDSRFGRTAYQYDARGRLFSAELPSGATDYRAPDALGNLYRTADRHDRRFVRGGIVRNDREASFAFDRAGNLALRIVPPAEGAVASTWRYDWNGTGMLTRVVRPDGTEVCFAYDALGRRVSKKVGAVETRSVWDGDLLLHELQADEAPLTWYHQPETFSPIAKFEGDRGYHIVGDHLGTPMAIYDQVGAAVWQGQLDIFGELVDADNSARVFCPWRWPGQYEDQETGLYYNRFRYYAPTLGQYISQDPIGLMGGVHAYAYVRDPFTHIDPFGLVTILAHGAVKVKAFAGPSVGGKEHRPLHIHLEERRVTTRVLMEDWIDAGRLKGRALDVYPGDPVMTKNMRQVIEKNASVLKQQAQSVFTTGKKCP